MRRVTIFIERYLFSLGACLYLFLFGFLTARNRRVFSSICSHFGFNPDQQSPLRFGTITGDELVHGGDDQVRLRELTYVEGNVSVLELVIIAKLVRRHQPQNIFEIGTFDGRTALNMAINSPDSARVFTLDLPQSEAANAKLPISDSDMTYINKDSSGSRFRDTAIEKKIELLYGDSAVFDFSPYHNKIDFLFIDGAHSYEYVLNDTRAALKMLRNEKGVILWHDCVPHSSVALALNELYATYPQLKNLQLIEGTMLACCICNG